MWTYVESVLLSGLLCHYLQVVLKNISAIKCLITINLIQNESFCLHNICMCTVYICYVYI